MKKIINSALFQQCLQVLIAVDQLVNTLLGLVLVVFGYLINWLKVSSVDVVAFIGWADETLSARAYRRREVFAWLIAMWVIDLLFLIVFWQTDHCKKSYESEQQRRQLPPSYRY